MDQPSVAVLVPAHNEAGTIGDVIYAVRNQTYPVSQIIVVADACTDDTANIARRAGAVVIEVDHAHKGTSQNSGLDKVNSDIVVGFDGDTIPERHCIQHIVFHMIQDNYDAVSTAVLPIQVSGFLVRSRRFSYALGTRWWRTMHSAVGRVSVLSGACYGFRTTVLRNVGGFSLVPISEDRDITWRMHEAKHKVGFVPKALVYTLEPETLVVYKRQVNRWAAGFFQVTCRHRKQMSNPRSAFVIGTGLFDLMCIPLVYVAVLTSIAVQPQRLWGLLVWTILYAVASTAVVSTHIGLKHALAGVGPHAVLNIFDKWLYLKAFVREWILDSHYTGWTGRHDRTPSTTPIRLSRVVNVIWWQLIVLTGYFVLFGSKTPSLWIILLALLIIPWWAMFSVPEKSVSIENK